jgi:uncharacterized cofD-like protein
MLSDIPQKNRLRIVVLGGGTGTFTVLSGLKRHPVELSAVVTVSDNGGSTGILRDELGVLPPGDIRQCLVALSSGDEMMRRVFNYRFPSGSLQGHTLGNLFLSALQEMCGGPLEAVKQAQQILRVRGRVIPVSPQASNLYAELTDKTVVVGEHAIDEPSSQRAPIDRCFLDPPVTANAEAVDIIRDADIVVMGPGDLYTSLIPVLLVDGIVDALCDSNARRIYVLNLVTKGGQTDGFTATRFCSEIEKYLAPLRLDSVIANCAVPPPEVMERYAEAHDASVFDDLDDHWKVLRAPLISDRITGNVVGDKLKRSVLRHDPAKLAAAILDVAQNLPT